MGWPDDGTDLPIIVQAAFGANVTADPWSWAWTDLSGRLLEDERISMTVGRSPGASIVSPSTCTIPLLSDDGALTPLHPMSPYYPNVEIGTPVRVRLRRAQDTFTRTVSGGWGSADSGQAWAVATGGTSAWSVGAGAGQVSISAVNSYRRILLPTTLADAEQRISITPSVALTGASLVWQARFRYLDANNSYGLSVELDRNTGSGLTVTCKIRKMVGGTVTDLAVASPVPGVLYTAGQPVHMRAAVVGARLAVKAWVGSTEPTAWSVQVDDTTFTAAGQVGYDVYLVSGNTNTLPYVLTADNYELIVDRFSGFADEWDVEIIPGEDGPTSVATITASGILRRITQGEPLAMSPMRRTITASSPVAYWPLEDGQIAGQAASALPGHPAAVLIGNVAFKPIADYFGDNPAADVFGTTALADITAGGQISAVVPAAATAATATRWAVRTTTVVDVLALTGAFVMLEWTTPGGTYVRWQLIMTPLSHTQVVAYDAAGTAFMIIDGNGASPSWGQQMVIAYQSGANIVVELWRNGGVGGLPQDSTTTPATLAGITSLSGNTTGLAFNAPTALGHWAIWPATTPPIKSTLVPDSYGVSVGTSTAMYIQEAATDRLPRLVREDGIPFSAPATSAAAVIRMWSQPIGVPTDLYGECVDVDMGLLYERSYGLSYLPREYRYNSPVALTVDLADYYATAADTGRVISPAYSDRDVRNEWTVERADGSEATVADAAHQQRSGRRRDSIQLNLADDSRLLDLAAWRVHLDTVAELRDDTIPIDLAGNPDLIDSWLRCGIGSRIARTNPPTQYPGTSERIIEGWSEQMGRRSWSVQITNPTPARPWDVAEVDGAQVAAVDGSTVGVGGLALGGTSFQLVTTGALWTTDPADFPRDVSVGGERITLSAVSGGSSPQTATVSARGVNGVTRAHGAGTAVDVWQPAIVAL